MRGLVLEVVELFGARRCMFNSNWHINGAISNSDGPLESDAELTMEVLYGKFFAWTSHLSDEDRDWLFAKSAESFYRI